MEAIENLKVFRENIDNNRFEPTEEAIDWLGDELIKAASTYEGYSELVWQIGNYLLVASEVLNESADRFYDKFGYATVANALQVSIEEGNFSMGLGFICYDFLPSGGLEAVVHHPLIQQALLILQGTKVMFSLQCFRDTPNVIKISSQFLNYSSVLQIPVHIRLQIAAILLQIAVNEHDRELATRTLLNQLACGEKTISLFYCWRAACEQFPDLWNESAYMESLLVLLKASRKLSEQGVALLSHLHMDEDLLSVISGDTRMLYLMGLSGWWLYVRYKHTEGKEIAWQLINSILKTYPNLCKALQSNLENERPPEQSQEKIEQLQKDFQREMRTLNEELRVRIYRGVPLTLKIQRYNHDHILQPLYEALEGSSTLSDNIRAEIHKLIASELLDENPLQRDAASYLRIIGELRSNMIKDYETIVMSFRRVLELREKLSASMTEIGSTLPLSTPEIQQEITTIQQSDPELRWMFEWFLPETVQSKTFAELS